MGGRSICGRPGIGGLIRFLGKNMGGFRQAKERRKQQAEKAAFRH
jgi:hypothetical protein